MMVEESAEFRQQIVAKMDLARLENLSSIVAGGGEGSSEDETGG